LIFALKIKKKKEKRKKEIFIIHVLCKDNNSTRTEHAFESRRRQSRQDVFFPVGPSTLPSVLSLSLSLSLSLYV
jgi:hypothetical protein